MRVLVVDDSATVRSRLVEMLSALPGVGHIDTASRASDASRAIQSGQPDVVVLDIRMPEGSGVEVLNRLRASRQRVTTIVLTNNPIPQWRRECLRAGADFFFDKSSEFQQAVDVIGLIALNHAAHRDQLRQRWALFEQLPTPAWLFDAESLEFSAVNEAAVRRYGYSRDEFLAMTVADIREPSEVPAMLEDIAQRQAGAADNSAGLRRHLAKDGTVIHVEIAVVPFDRERRLDLVLAHDISERIVATEALRASEHRYRELFENATDAIFTTGLDLNFTSFNGAAEALTGYTREEALGLNVGALVTLDVLDAMRRRLTEQQPGEPAPMVETTMLTRDGRSIPIEARVRLLRANGRPIGSQGIARDISQRKRLEQELRQGQKMEAIGRLAGGIAHDFNNLLTVIIGRSQQLVESLVMNDDARAEAAQILEAGEHAARLTRQLLAFSRQQIVAPEVLDLNAAVARQVPLLRRLIGEDVHLQIGANAERPAVMADPGQLEQVIMNLLVNARDAMPHGGTVTINTANVDMDAAAVASFPFVVPGEYVLLEVTDTGEGMDATAKAHLFEPFYTTKAPDRGTGLGLSTVYSIIKQSRGYILVDSEPGQGSKFRIYYPLAKGTIEAAATPAASGSPERGTESILVVEDDPAVRALVQLVLSARGYNVLAASSPEEAQRICDSRPGCFDLLLTDVVMPGMTGAALADALIERNPKLSVLYMSGYSTAGAQGQMAHPQAAFVGKPFTPSVLAAKVRGVLDSVQ